MSSGSSGVHLPLKLMVAVLSLISFVVAMGLYGPILQDHSYHDFSDSRTILTIHNFYNVISNIPFVIIGLVGLQMCFSKQVTANCNSGNSFKFQQLHGHYVVFFIGILLTGIGSSYYHLAPDDGTLVWDRLPMTISFMAFFSLIIADHASVKLARGGLFWLLLLGFLSIVYWVLQGDLRLYAIVQFLPILLIPVLMVGSKECLLKRSYVWMIIALYGLAKVLEHFDLAFFDALSVISGHSLKHIAAAGASLVVLVHFIEQKRSLERLK